MFISRPRNLTYLISLSSLTLWLQRKVYLFFAECCAVDSPLFGTREERTTAGSKLLRRISSLVPASLFPAARSARLAATGMGGPSEITSTLLQPAHVVFESASLAGSSTEWTRCV